jgi:hypothetical protein
MTTAVKILSGLIGLVAALFWFLSAAVDPPTAPGAAFGGTSPIDPFNVALRDAAHWNRWAAAATGVSVLLLVVAECMDLWNSTCAKRTD